MLARHRCSAGYQGILSVGKHWNEEVLRATPQAELSAWLLTRWEVAEPFSAASGTSCSPCSPPEVFSQLLPLPELSLRAPSSESWAGKCSWKLLPSPSSSQEMSTILSFWLVINWISWGKHGKMAQDHLLRSLLASLISDTVSEGQRMNILSVWTIWHSQMLTPVFAVIAKASVASSRTSSFCPVFFKLIKLILPYFDSLGSRCKRRSIPVLLALAVPPQFVSVTSNLMWFTHEKPLGATKNRISTLNPSPVPIPNNSNSGRGMLSI